MHRNMILLVEDNPDHRELILMSLRENQVVNDIVVTEDGAEALDYLFCTGKYAGREADNPSLILLDLKLPRLGGIEVLKRIRANPQTQYIPVVMLTSSSEDEDIMASFDHGANSYVRKPVDFSRFADKLRSLEAYWLMVNEVPKHPA